MNSLNEPFFSFPEPGTVENQIGTSGLDLCIATETFGLCLCILIMAHCHIKTFYFHSFQAPLLCMPCAIADKQEGFVVEEWAVIIDG